MNTRNFGTGELLNMRIFGTETIEDEKLWYRRTIERENPLNSETTYWTGETVHVTGENKVEKN